MPLLHRAIHVIELGCAKVSSDTDESGIEPNSPRSIIPSQCLTPNVYNFDLFQLNSVTGRLNCDTNSPHPILSESIPVSALTLWCKGSRNPAGAVHRIRTCKPLRTNGFQDRFLTTRTYGVYGVLRPHEYQFSASKVCTSSSFSSAEASLK